MLDDQNVTISNVKSQLKQKDEDLYVQTEKQGKYHSKYEDRLATANEEAERQRQRADDFAFRVQELEEDIEAIRVEAQELQDEMQRKVSSLQDKEAIIDLVESEVAKIKDSQDADRRAAQEKDNIIEDLTLANENLVRQSDIKGDEIRTLIEKMEGYKRTKDQEALRLRKKLAGAEEDIKVLILEQDRQKKVANEKIKMLHDMFQ